MLGRGICLLTAYVLVATPAGRAQAVQFFDSGGVQIHYVDHGKGEPVLLVHGFTGSYARHFESPGMMLSALTDAGYRVVAFDCRGHGQSGKPEDSKQYGLEMVRDVVRLLDHLHIDRAHVVGYSMGGQITNKLLVEYPQRLLTATLIGAGWEGEDLRELTTQLEEAAAAFDRRDAGFLVRALTPPGQPAPTDEQIAATNASLFSRNEPKVLGAVMRGMIRINEIPGDKLRANRVPTLALVGEQDRRIQDVKRLAGVMSNLEVVVLPGATHATSVGMSAKHLVSFLGRQVKK